MGALYSYFSTHHSKAQSSGLSPSATDDAGQKGLAAAAEGNDAEKKPTVSAAEEKAPEEPESNDTSYGVEATAVRTLAASTGTVAILGTTAKVKEAGDVSEVEEETVVKDEVNLPNIAITEAEVIVTKESPEEESRKPEELEVTNISTDVDSGPVEKHQESEQTATEISQKSRNEEGEIHSSDMVHEVKTQEQELDPHSEPPSEKLQEPTKQDQDKQDTTSVLLSGISESSEVSLKSPTPLVSQQVQNEESQKPIKDPVRIVDYQEKKDMTQRRYEEKAEEETMPYMDEKRLSELKKPPDPGDPGDPGDPNLTPSITGTQHGEQLGERKRSTDSEIGSPDDSRTEEDNEISSEQLKTNSLSDMSISEALNSNGEEAAREAAKAQELQEMVASLSAAANQEVLGFELALNDMTPASQGPSQTGNITRTSAYELDTTIRHSTPDVQNLISKAYVTEKLEEIKETYVEDKIKKDESFELIKNKELDEPTEQKEMHTAEVQEKEILEIKEPVNQEVIIDTEQEDDIVKEIEVLSEKELEKSKEPEKESVISTSPEEETTATDNIPLDDTESDVKLPKETESVKKPEEEAIAKVTEYHILETPTEADSISTTVEEGTENQDEIMKEVQETKEPQKEDIKEEELVESEKTYTESLSESEQMKDDSAKLEIQQGDLVEHVAEAEQPIALHKPIKEFPEIEEDSAVKSTDKTDIDHLKATDHKQTPTSTEKETTGNLNKESESTIVSPKSEEEEKAIVKEEISLVPQPQTDAGNKLDDHKQGTSTEEIAADQDKLIKDVPEGTQSPQYTSSEKSIVEADDSLNTAAITIQSSFRGFKVRKELKGSDKDSAGSHSSELVKEDASKEDSSKAVDQQEISKHETGDLTQIDKSSPANIPEPVMKLAEEEVNRICEEAERATESLLTPPPLIEYSDIRESEQDESEDFPAPPDDLLEMTEKNDVTKDQDSSDTVSTEPTIPLGSNTEGDSSKTEDTTAPSLAESEIKSAEPTPSQQIDNGRLESSLTDNLNTEVAVHRDSTEGELTMEEDSKDEELGSVIQSSKDQELKEKEKEMSVASADSETKDKAAVIIQAGFRGFQTRKALKKESDAAQTSSVLSQSPQDTSSDKNYITDEDLPTREDSEPDFKDSSSSTSRSEHEIIESAKKIQAGIRGYLVRKEQKVKRDAAIKIQSHFRGFKTRQRLKEEST